MTTVAVTQRWRDGRHGWRPASEGGFNPDRYTVSEIGEPTAAAFVRRHHYSTSWPSARLRYGLHDGPRLVGAIVLGVPMSKAVLTNPFPTLEPYVESLELSRLVLLDEVPANAESWFCASAFRLAADRGVRGVVAFSDPEPRWRRAPGKAPEQIKPGHVGIVYQALNFSYLGRATRRSLVVLPDATTVPARALAKVTGGERGRDGVIRGLVARGAAEPRDGEDPAAWLRTALRTVGAIRQQHPGNHRYAIRTGRTRAERTRVAIGMASHTYPKATLSLFAGEGA
ncbi:hypothetical protein ABN028_19625 [Actinopolymorpha sp. B17G11]|uniref:Mom family adenine methylcarbamoylation protein n=1 Tax=Actinopolymorpha sp. B17G11 TaxID=3160861 RepID=UPI0032E46666